MGYTTSLNIAFICFFFCRFLCSIIDEKGYNLSQHGKIDVVYVLNNWCFYMYFFIIGLKYYV